MCGPTGWIHRHLLGTGLVENLEADWDALWDAEFLPKNYRSVDERLYKLKPGVSFPELMEHLPLFLSSSPFHHFLPAAVLWRIKYKEICASLYAVKTSDFCCQICYKRLIQAVSFHPIHGHVVQCCGHLYLALSVCTTEGHIWLFKIQNTLGNFGDSLDARHACTTYERTELFLFGFNVRCK